MRRLSPRVPDDGAARASSLSEHGKPLLPLEDETIEDALRAALLDAAPSRALSSSASTALRVEVVAELLKHPDCGDVARSLERYASSCLEASDDAAAYRAAAGASAVARRAAKQLRTRAPWDAQDEEQWASTMEALEALVFRAVDAAVRRIDGRLDDRLDDRLEHIGPPPIWARIDADRVASLRTLGASRSPREKAELIGLGDVTTLALELQVARPARLATDARPGRVHVGWRCHVAPAASAGAFSQLSTLRSSVYRPSRRTARRQPPTDRLLARRPTTSPGTGPAVRPATPRTASSRRSTRSGPRTRKSGVPRPHCRRSGRSSTKANTPCCRCRRRRGRRLPRTRLNPSRPRCCRRRAGSGSRRATRGRSG